MSKKQDLLNQVDACSAKLSSLMVETHRAINDALIKGDLDMARQLQWVNDKHDLDLADLKRRQIKLIDDSKEMSDAIDSFTAVNKSIEDAIKATNDLAKFLQTITAISGVLGKLIGFALA